MIPQILVGALVVLYAFYRFWFLRDPHRTVPKGNVIVSPAMGRISKIIEIGAGQIEIAKGIRGRITVLTSDTIRKGYLIVIVMTPFDVHYQRMPIDGNILSVKYKRGSFLNAVKGNIFKATLENEHNEILIQSKAGRIKVIQIAGFVARRIICLVKRKDKLKIGQDLGLIKLGSQVALILPKLSLQVKEGQYVTDGETIIATY